MVTVLFLCRGIYNPEKDASLYSFDWEVTMATLQVRNIPPDIYSRLKAASRTHHRSISGEVLAILESALGHGEEYGASTTISSIQSVREVIQQQYGKSESSVESIREDRDR